MLRVQLFPVIMQRMIAVTTGHWSCSNKNMFETKSKYYWRFTVAMFALQTKILRTALLSLLRT